MKQIVAAGPEKGQRFQIAEAGVNRMMLPAEHDRELAVKILFPSATHGPRPSGNTRFALG